MFAGVVRVHTGARSIAGRLRPAPTAAVAALLLLATTATGAPASGYGSGAGPIPATPYVGFNPVLARAPYVTDLTQTSAVVTWATNPNIHGALTFGPLGNCTANTIPVVLGMVMQVRVSPNPTITYPSRLDYQSSVAVMGLVPGTTYCYEVFGSGTSAVDLLPASQPFQVFTTLDAADHASQASLTFDVIGDLGETSDRGPASNATYNNPTSVNSNQAAIDKLIGSSGARFVVAVGDVAYNDGGNYNYGDLEQNGTNLGGPGLTEISDVFGPSYWPLTGGIAAFVAGGNHGVNANLLNTWPEASSAAGSSGTYSMQPHPSVDGTTVASYPSAWYAFSSGAARFYILDASWSDANLGSAAGSACPYTAGMATCKAYQVDADAHWQPTSAEYQWLSADLQAHPGGVKLAFFHYPLRSDNATQDSDVYLQQTLEPLLAHNGVQIAFSGHAHDYERNVAPGPGTIVSYVTGGGGGVISTVAGKGCSAWDAYAIGWTYSSGTGQRCGTAAVPASDAQVYHFLRVIVQGSRVDVQPTNAAGQVFDEQVYDFAPMPPASPTNVAASAITPTSVSVSWTASNEATGDIASYVLTRNQAPLASVSGTITSYLDTSAAAGGSYSYGVAAVDQAGVASAVAPSNPVTTPLIAGGFESGSLTGWSPVVGLVSVQAATVHGGAQAAALASTGDRAFALQNLPAASTAIYAQAWVDISAQSTALTFFGLRTQATSTAPAYQVVQVYVNAAGTVKILNNVTKASYLGNATIAPGGWHRLTLAVDEQAGTIRLWLDGAVVMFSTAAGSTSTLSGQNLGATAVGNFQLGDDSTGRTYSWFADDVVVSGVPITP